MVFRREEAIGQGDGATLRQRHCGAAMHICFYMPLSQLNSSFKHRNEPNTTLRYCISLELISAPRQKVFVVCMLHEMPDLFCYRKMVRHLSLHCSIWISNHTVNNS